VKLLVTVLLILLALLQYRLWVGDGGVAEVWRLHKAIQAQQSDNASLVERNRALEAEVRDLRQGLAAVEERARTDLGMIKEGETFFQVIEPPGSPVQR
jgi:cell division protein FtsB